MVAWLVHPTFDTRNAGVPGRVAQLFPGSGQVGNPQPMGAVAIRTGAL
jgi:hypothetical protein